MSAEWVGEARETRCLMMFFDSHVPKPHQNVKVSKCLTGNRHTYKLFVRLTLAIIGTAICLKKTNLPYGKSPSTNVLFVNIKIMFNVNRMLSREVQAARCSVDSVRKKGTN
jgi:hypothetical protein